MPVTKLKSTWSGGALVFEDYSKTEVLMIGAGVVSQQTKTTNYTMTAADCGILTKVGTDAVVITLPATVVGLTFTIQNVAADGAALISVSPNASDQLIGHGITPADNKDLQNTKATARKGDFVRLIANGTTGWLIQEVRGVWAREA